MRCIFKINFLFKISIPLFLFLFILLIIHLVGLLLINLLNMEILKSINRLKNIITFL